MDYDVAVIGGGPGGYVAAIKAAQLGARVLLVEKEKLGGVCLHRGCIPTKTLLNSAEKWQELQHLAEFGLSADHPAFDFSRVKNRMAQVVTQMERGIMQLIKSNDIELVNGVAELQSSHELRVQTAAGIKKYTASKMILAAGSEPVGLPVAGGELEGVINSDQLLGLREVPKSLLVIGGGAVGLEFASAFAAFGAEVTVVEMMPQILPGADSDVVKRLGLALRKQGIKMLTDTKVVGLAQEEGGLKMEVITKGADAKILKAEKVLVAIGRRPLTAGLGLEAAGVKYSVRGIEVDETMQTSVAGVYAVGDGTGKSMLAHAASHAGSAAAQNAMGGRVAVDFSAVPSCVFTIPEVAMVGLTEQTAAAKGIDIAVSKFNFAANGKAVSLGQTDGLVKIIADKRSGRVLGMHIVGPHASDLIMEGTLTIANRLTAQDISHTIHPHPTLSETVMECAQGIGGEAIHQAKIRR